MLNSGQDIQYNATTGKIVKVSEIDGADGTAVIANKTVARDKGIINKSCTITHYPIIPTTGVLVDVDHVGTGLSANDTGCRIAGYRLDYFKGAGKAVCSAFNNRISVSACNPGNTNCPASAVH